MQILLVSDVKKGIFAQAIAQLIFSVVGGQHLSILLTTAPLCLFVKSWLQYIIFAILENLLITLLNI